LSNLKEEHFELGGDSLDEVEIILELEHKFGIPIPDNIIPEVQNIGRLCKYIEKELGKPGEQLSKMETPI
jgi:acyl carrier protein